MKVIPAAFALLILILILPASGTFGETPTGSPQANLQDLISQAVNSKAPTLKLPPGTYILTPTSTSTPLIEISKASNLNIDATGVRIVGTKLVPALSIDDSSHVAIHGLTIDYDPLPFTQGTIVAIDPASHYLDVKLDPGYPDTEAYTRCGVSDPTTREQKADTEPTYGVPVKRVGDRLLRVASSEGSLRNVRIGDLFVLAAYHHTPPAVRITNCGGMVLEDVTIWSAPSIAIFERGGAGGNTYRRVQVTPGPTPAGAAAPRLRSSVADGLHSTDTARGPLVEDCVFERMADDGIAVHSSYSLVLEPAAGGVIFSAKEGRIPRPGESIEIDSPAGLVRGTAKVKSVTELAGYSAEKLKSVLHDYVWDAEFRYYTKAWQMELDSPPGGTAAGDRVSINEHRGDGFVLRGNRISQNRGHGILVRASDGVIENNTIMGSSRSGITLTPDQNWNEAGFSHNVTIRNNTIRDVGNEAFLMKRPDVGAITVCAIEEKAPNSSKNFAYSPPGGQTQIAIENNHVENCATIGLLIASAGKVEVKGNTFSKTQALVQNDASRFGNDGAAVIWVTQTQGIDFENNHLLSPGAATRHFLETTDSVSGLKGGEDMLAWKPGAVSLAPSP